MADVKNNLISPEIREKAAKYVKERFRYVDLEDPVADSLFQFGVEYAARDMVDHPYSYRDNGQEDKTQIARPINETEMSLAPLELFINDIKLPALPQVLIELLQVINAPDSSAADLAEVIAMDTSLSSYLLRLVNSAYYNFPFPIDTILRAVTLIGTREISLLAFSTSFLRVFNESPPKTINMEQFWKHSIACAITARILAQQCGKINPQRHFLCGLLHDIGRLVIYSKIPELADEVIALGGNKCIPLYEAEEMVLGFNHARFGGSLIRRWNFPSTLIAAVRYHHSPQMGGSYDEPCTVHIADTIIKALGIGTSGESYVPPINTQIWDDLSLSTQDLGPIIKELDGELEATFSILVEIK